MVRCPERRNLDRYPVVDMRASISVRYRFGTHQGDVIDFNRLGVTIVLRRPIPVNKPLYVTLRYAGTRLEPIVGAAHHCRFTPDGSFRCGIRFRTNSPMQLDRDEIDAQLLALERTLAQHTAPATT
jgi:PilZ domain